MGTTLGAPRTCAPTIHHTILDTCRQHKAHVESIVPMLFRNDPTEPSTPPRYAGHVTIFAGRERWPDRPKHMHKLIESDNVGEGTMLPAAALRSLQSAPSAPQVPDPPPPATRLSHRWPHRVGKGQKRHPAREPFPLRQLAKLRALAFSGAQLAGAAAAIRRGQALRYMPLAALRRTSFARAQSPASAGRLSSPT